VPQDKELTKTVYDPSRWSDDDLLTAATEAAGDAFDRNELPPEGYVEVYDPINEVYVAEQDFILVLLDVARDVLKIHLAQETGDAAWQKQMQIQLAALEARLEQ